MAVLGIDYSSGDPNPARLKAERVRFVCRYVSTPTNPKNLRAAEAKKLRAAGIDIVVVFETTAGRALAGRDAGARDARSALRQANERGAPEGSPIYFAVDFDAQPGHQQAINAYLNGAASVLGKNLVGVYAGYGPVKRALDAGVCKYAWQTYAWSHGNWDPRAHIQQYRNGVDFAGLNVDLDRAMFRDFGQWPRPKRYTGPVDFVVANKVVKSGTFQKSRKITRADVGKTMLVATPELTEWVKAVRLHDGVGRVRKKQ